MIEKNTWRVFVPTGFRFRWIPYLNLKELLHDSASWKLLLKLYSFVNNDNKNPLFSLITEHVLHLNYPQCFLVSFKLFSIFLFYQTAILRLCLTQAAELFCSCKILSRTIVKDLFQYYLHNSCTATSQAFTVISFRWRMHERSHSGHETRNTQAVRNNCLSFYHRVCCSNEYLREAKRSAIFTQERLQEGEKRGFIYA